MSSCSSSLLRLLGLLSLLCVGLGSLLGAEGCARGHICGGVELCNGKDDNCDGRVDEGFVDDTGRYVGTHHCGRCSVDCDDVFPDAASTQCDVSPAEPVCRLKTCPAGFHALNGTTCAPDEVVLCLPCEFDSDCATRKPGALCLELPEQRRCGTPCSASQPCPRPFRCDSSLGQCVPEGSFCACDTVTDTVEVGCLTRGTVPDLYCAGVATCRAGSLSSCMITAVESCDGEDDDCDGEFDEDFRDAQGRYVGRLHCGACNKPCSPPGEHYAAQCIAEGTSVRCDIACEPGFVDVDGIQGNGCECQRFDGSSAPGSSGGDNDCDGVVDDDTTFVHVASFGNDSGVGTLLSPLRSIQTAVNLGAQQGKSVLVAQGHYDAFEMVAGVSVFGGYRTDFGARDPNLYPVVIEHAEPRDGVPVLRCRGLAQASAIDGLTVVGSDATSAGTGSTAVVFEACGPAVKLSHMVVLSGRGADGQAGPDAANRLPAGTPSLAALAGLDGSPGQQTTNPRAACVTLPGGASAQKGCGMLDVSGGAGGAATCPALGCTVGQPCANAGCTDFTTNGVCDFSTVLARAIPSPRASPGRGTSPGIAGESTFNAPTTRGGCDFCDDNPTLPRLGADGRDGVSGSFGAGGSGCGQLAITLDSSGRGSAHPGFDGQSGASGSGGGGGSGGAGYSVIRGTVGVCNDVPGGSGGSGGSGGCGAPSGAGGQGGGASVAILVIADASGFGPTFEAVRVVTASGGRGGDGGIGAAGGRGGLGASGGNSQFWCARSGGRGGDGGEGGSGGGGGGGCGGATHAVLLSGAVSGAYRSQLGAGVGVELAGVAGQGGRGGFSPGISGVAGLTGSDVLIP
jgi:hypothetical protein